MRITLKVNNNYRHDLLTIVQTKTMEKENRESDQCASV